ncbi:phage holin family protein [Pseudoflavonifractor sp. DSM 107456]|uniref:Phage holin family protein n=1 Tax=Pseudoflavonifractor gallinarum TaxID=2779352 RepID=A0ABR9R9D3_9FIRM|nr:phage holin family protein [Pseudoflavonifractor gallinarum]MBE5055296.1 phage holin family protein [Pseudoflavonifractor gallinarum]
MENIPSVFSAFADKANLIGAAIVSGLTYVFGVHWPVFALFLGLNVIDYIYGLMKARATGTLSSAKGARGIVKKFSYWVIVSLSFGVSFVLMDLGTVLGINLGFLQLIGWFTLAVYILNELTSIVENMVALGVDVPEILVKGLAAARTAVDEAGDKVVPGDKAE